jgi:hypothetical protein
MGIAYSKYTHTKDDSYNVLRDFGTASTHNAVKPQETIVKIYIRSRIYEHNSNKSIAKF